VSRQLLGLLGVWNREDKVGAELGLAAHPGRWGHDSGIGRVTGPCQMDGGSQGWPRSPAAGFCQPCHPRVYECGSPEGSDCLVLGWINHAVGDKALRVSKGGKRMVGSV
jgi:hypothetical protein